MHKVLCVPDMHLPWVDAKALGALYAAIEKEQSKSKKNFSVICQLGDLYDMYAQSRFPRNYDIMTPKEEMAEGRHGAENFWKNCRKLASRNTRCIQILGNHDARPSKQVADRYPEIASLLGIDHIFKFPGVETVLDSRSELQIDGTIYTHGHFTRHGQHAAYYGRSVVHGHTHRAAVIYQKFHEKVIFELDCGTLCDMSAEPLQYTPTKTTKWTLGYGIVDEDGPRFISL